MSSIAKEDVLFCLLPKGANKTKRSMQRPSPASSFSFAGDHIGSPYAHVLIPNPSACLRQAGGEAAPTKGNVS
jgi:hypothetical protein